ncbi:hypothetical protein AJ80_09512 [Polytolypa hystricis UAMH7299]|uniref:PH domain-containing protein n=1 Tax=Polytolypa hystricis (strain UAMH7299) TaxID=1447883 RepID=A0A2B7WGZ0_POLH7|nr:hypothetical protein AJ80_09512 [Polytolypa hystricis UAMH7299]
MPHPRSRDQRPFHTGQFNNNQHYNHPQHRAPPASYHTRNPSNLAQPSDYESDFPTDYYISDANMGNNAGRNGNNNNHNNTNNTTNNNNNASATASAPSVPAPVPTRTNEELNLAVLQRHNHSISSILSLAPYAVVYIFSPTTQLWEKSGIEGTLFVCQLTQGDIGEERYKVIVLNRRGMNNFQAPLLDGGDVELTEDYVILKVDGNEGKDASGGNNSNNNNNKASGAQGTTIYGLWIFSEPPPSSTAETRAINAQFIKECAVHAGKSSELAKERLAAAEHSQAATAGGPSGAGQEEEEAPMSVPMGRQISLKEMFGQQRAQDDEWSVKVHSPALRAMELSSDHFTQEYNENQNNFKPEGGFISAAQQQQRALAQSQGQNWPTGRAQQGTATYLPVARRTDAGQDIPQDVLGDLFRRAGLGYQGHLPQ